MWIHLELTLLSNRPDEDQEEEEEEEEAAPAAKKVRVCGNL